MFVALSTNKWNKKHPFDAENGVVTHGYLPRAFLGSQRGQDDRNTGYAGCQPSCLRRALSSIVPLSDFTFVDIGCGMGRALVVASEFPFRAIHGIEISPDLARLAERNASTVHRRHPRRTVIRIQTSDALHATLPHGNLVLFLYHPFDEGTLGAFLGRIASLDSDANVFLVYENPIHGGVLDDTKGFARWFAETVPCGPSEVGFAPDRDDAVVVWRWAPGQDAEIREAATVAIDARGNKATLRRDG